MKKMFIILLLVLFATSACLSNKTEEKVKNEDAKPKAIKEVTDEQDKKAEKDKDKADEVIVTVELDPELELFEQLTYLSAEFDTSDCKMISQLVSEDLYSYDVSLLFDAKVIEKLGLDFVNMLKAEVDAAGYNIISEYCETENHKYVTVSDADAYDSVKILVQAPEPGFTMLAEIDGLMDFGYSFQPEAEALGGDHLVKTGYADAGAFWWRFHRVDAESGEVELLEDCTGGSEDFTDEENNNFLYSCDLLYDPEVAE
ncbi:hypothetical protein HY605_05780 [Candidatus Peregrinibacteria bacterium]|nr:hypothetical protein [Candidatus Peregrinibacteria bacterium]